MEKKRMQNTGEIITESFDRGTEGYKIGGVIKEIRKEAEISQDELARRLSTKRSAISRWENRAEDIKLSTLLNLAEKCGYQIKIDAIKRGRALRTTTTPRKRESAAQRPRPVKAKKAVSPSRSRKRVGAGK